MNNEKAIDFWTNSFDEIFLQFRYNKDTNELEMQQIHDVDKRPLDKPLPKPKSIQSRRQNNPKLAESTTDTAPNLKPRIARTSIQVTDPQANSVTTMKAQTWLSTTSKPESIQILNQNNPKQTETPIDSESTQKPKPDIMREKSSGAQARPTTTMNPLSVESCARNCPKEPHIACGNQGTLSPNCSSNTTVFQLEPHHRELLVHLHNDLRNKLAGNLTEFEPAAHMATLQWHQELADYALLNAMKCDGEHDWCHTTNEFQRPGQNLAWRSWTSRQTTEEDILECMVNDWHSEHEYTRQSDLDSYQGEGVGDNVISHFTALVNERNKHMGCGAIQTKEGRKTKILLACNYARNNIFNAPIYVKGPTTGLCSTGVNPDYTNLCSIDEVYDYNN